MYWYGGFSRKILVLEVIVDFLLVEYSVIAHHRGD